MSQVIDAGGSDSYGNNKGGKSAQCRCVVKA